MLDGIKPMDITKPSFISSVLQPSAPIAQSQPVQTQTQKPDTSSITQPTQVIMSKDGTPLDAGVVNLARSIRQKESGGNYNISGDNGTSTGAYQWQPGNFQNQAKQFGLDPSDFSPENQDKVAYAQIASDKAKGLTPEQIASKWNSGKTDPNGNVGTKMINGKEVSFDTPKYVSDVMNYFQQFKQTDPGQTDQSQFGGQQTPTKPDSPSVGGFAGNIVTSGANFLGNIANAVVHPLDTLQNLGETAEGGLQKLGGQDNENTAKFDALTSYFKERYGGVDNLLHTAYTDPVGLAGDISAVLGVGGGIAGVVGKGAEIGGIGELADVSKSVASSLGKASEMTNPLTLPIKGAGALLNKGGDMIADTAGGLVNRKGFALSDIVKNPGNYTPEEVANYSKDSITKDVQNAFDTSRENLSETGSMYNPIKNSAQFTEVAPDSLAKLIERNAGVTVDENGVVQSGGKLIEPQQVKALQNLYDVFNPKFASGELTANEFLQLRDYVNNKMAKFGGQVIADKELSSVGKGIYADLNKLYRPNIQGLTELDSEFSTKINKINELEDGLVYKTGTNKGELKSSFINKAGRALKNGETDELAQLEEVVPGITKRLQGMKVMQEWTKEVGGNQMSLLEKGGLGYGVATGNIPIVAGSLATLAFSNPDFAIPVLRMIGNNKALFSATMANMAKLVNIGGIGNQASQQGQQNTAQMPQSVPDIEPQSPQSQQNQLSQSSSSSVNDNSGSQFDTQGALKAGYTQKEIDDFVKNR